MFDAVWFKDSLLHAHSFPFPIQIGETPFYVALDNKYKKVVICVRGTLSLQDVLTDLKADAETLPLDPVKEDWIGHKVGICLSFRPKKK